jgi:predicted transcriptional regulator
VDKLDKIFMGSEGDIKRRLNEIISDLGIPQTEFIKNTGIPYPTAYRYIKEDTSIKVDFLMRVAECYPQYNMDWVITGRGYMKYKNMSDVDVYHVMEKSGQYGDEYLKMKEKIIALQDELIDCMKHRNGGR